MLSLVTRPCAAASGSGPSHCPAPCAERAPSDQAMSSHNSFGARSSLTVDGQTYTYYALASAAALPGATVATLPFSLKVLLENLLRNEDGAFVKKDDVATLA